MFRISKGKNKAWSLAAYLQHRRFGLCIWAGLAGLACVVASVFSLPPQPLLYGLLLAVLGLLAACIPDYLRQEKRHDVLEQMLKRPAAESRELWPESLSELRPETPMEEACVELLQKQGRELEEKISRERSERKRLEAYYMLWTHQVKTPVSAMRLLLGEMEPSEERLLMETQLFYIEEYLGLLLGYMRLGSKSTDYLFEQVSLDEVLRAGIRKYAPLFIRRKLKLEFEPTGRKEVTDAKWLGFVVEQLLSNSLKYTAEGTISIGWEGGICIRDTGMGIPPEDLPRVQQEGYTGSNGRMEEKSTGLGLSLCRQICDQLSLELDISSRVGEGTRVCIRFRERGEL